MTLSRPTSVPSAGSYVGCIAGALSFAEFASGLETPASTDVSLTPTHQVTDGMHSVIARAVKSADTPAPALDHVELPMASAGCGCGSGGCC